MEARVFIRLEMGVKNEVYEVKAKKGNKCNLFTQLFSSQTIPHTRLVTRQVKRWGGGGVTLRWWLWWWTLCFMDCGPSSRQLKGIAGLTCSSWSCPEDSARPSWPVEPQSQQEEWAGRRSGWADVHPNISGNEAMKTNHKRSKWRITDTRLNGRLCLFRNSFKVIYIPLISPPVWSHSPCRQPAQPRSGSLRWAHTRTCGRCTLGAPLTWWKQTRGRSFPRPWRTGNAPCTRTAPPRSGVRNGHDGKRINNIYF